MLNNFFEFLNYDFVQRAFIAGSLVAVCAAVLGVILILKRYALIGHGLSEIAFASCSAANALNLPPLIFAAPVVIFAAFLILFISIKRRVGGDIAIAAVSSCALALGVIITSLSSGFNSSVYGYMFGSILALDNQDVILAIALSGFIILIFIIFYNRLFIITYNEEYARSLGLNVNFYQGLIALTTALVILTGMRIMGALLISSLIIFPALTARKLASSFRAIILIAALVALISFAAGIFISFIYNLPAGASIVIANAGLFMIIIIFKNLLKVICI
ncbi:MAG: metal ABC transporter permease [Synergistaceae bacterium]|nr:metal ABC transporter permease [Synergistaceae bacterium]